MALFGWLFFKHLFLPFREWLEVEKVAEPMELGVIEGFGGSER